MTDIGLSEEDIKKISQIYIVACGSAYHVGIAAQYVIEDLAKIPVRVELGSEFRYRKPLLDKNGLVVVISQSGETADSLAALREAKEKGVRTLGMHLQFLRQMNTLFMILLPYLILTNQRFFFRRKTN